ncbi:hypothetical protein EV677_2825 [Herminiimonas fonticola]|uniref:Uncharacterized protein n=1 Tax=Herminiimonas fonticola TaxID=303380 RepID=A0A4R6G3Z3_9BURK|nr:hypothetical protein EV677_2825 [Herminiimonas fonticola]
MESAKPERVSSALFLLYTYFEKVISQCISVQRVAL